MAVWHWDEECDGRAPPEYLRDSVLAAHSYPLALASGNASNIGLREAHRAWLSARMPCSSNGWPGRSAT